jgi:hypothetical protein
MNGRSPRVQTATQGPMSEEENVLDRLSDHELMDREAADRREFFQLNRVQPPLRGTTYRVIRASAEYLAAWHRWTASSAAARVRGLPFRRRTCRV